MNKYIGIIIIIVGLMNFGWLYWLTNQVTNYDKVIESYSEKIDSLESHTQILEALVEKQSEQNNKHEVTVYIKSK